MDDVNMELVPSFKTKKKLALYLAANMKDLNKLIVTKSFGRKLQMLCKASDRLSQRAIEASLTEPVDEEKMYILCQRYLHLIQNIRSHVNDERFFECRFSRTASKIEDLKALVLSSLIDRYSMNTHIIYPSVEQVKTVYFGVEERGRLNISEDDIFLTAYGFYDLITRHEAKTLIFDVRLEADFLECSLKVQNCVFISASITLQGLTTNTLLQKLGDEEAELFERRNDFEILILIDTDTDRISYTESKLRDLRVILTEWDKEERLQNNNKLPPLVLDGGLQTLADLYPTFLTYPNKFYTFAYGEFGDFIVDDGEIDYPELGDTESSVGVSTPSVADSFISIELPEDGSALPATVILQHILSICEHQVRIEEKMYALCERRIELKKKMLEDDIDREEAVIDLLELNNSISVSDSINIELDERRKILKMDFEAVESTTDLDALADISKDIATLDRKRLEKYDARRTLVRTEQDYDKSLRANPELMGEDLNLVTYKRKRSPRKPKANDSAPIPDRSTKPTALTRLENELKMMYSIFAGKGISGLVNLRNTCYMNTLIQCLRFCPTFLTYFVKNRHSRDTEPLSTAFGGVMVTLWNQNKIALRPVSLYNIICGLENGAFSTGQHEDAQEFYVFLTKELHNESVEYFEPMRECSSRLYDWRRSFNDTTSFINRTFFYQMEGSSMCPRCNSLVVKYDYGNSIFIPLPENGSAINLQERMYDYLVIHDDETFISKYCASCECKTKAQKVLGYYPPVLSVNLVRYWFNRAENTIIRLNNRCDFPTELKFGNATYDLRSVCLHTGNRDRGHYTAIAYHPFEERWVHYNDECSSYADITDEPLKIQCYMFFYTLSRESDNINKNFFQFKSLL